MAAAVAALETLALVGDLLATAGQLTCEQSRWYEHVYAYWAWEDAISLRVFGHRRGRTYRDDWRQLDYQGR